MKTPAAAQLLDKEQFQRFCDDRIARRTREIPKKYRKIYRKAVSKNKDAAITAFCLECVCWQKNEVINCTCPACPLFAVRLFVN